MEFFEGLGNSSSSSENINNAYERFAAWKFALSAIAPRHPLLKAPLKISLLAVELMVKANVSMKTKGNEELLRSLVHWVVQLDTPENLIRMQPEINRYLLE